MSIYFNSTHPVYGWLSNFEPVRIGFEGAVYPSVEAAYQAAKTDQPALRKQFENCPPVEARKRGRSLPMRKGFDQEKELVMLQLLREKFGKHEVWKRFLLNTGNHRLVHEAKWDSYWGNGPDGFGKNRLGHLIMQVRFELSFPEHGGGQIPPVSEPQGSC